MEKFVDGLEMLTAIEHGTDLYNPEKEIYVFLYNDKGSIAYYFLTPQEAYGIAIQAEATGDYWGGCLTGGGTIIDSPDCEHYTEDSETPLDWCDLMYVGTWYDTETYLEKIATGRN